MESENDRINDASSSTKKPGKRGIIYLSTIPPYMNVTKIREIFSEFGKVGRVYLQLEDKRSKHSDKKTKKKRIGKKFTEGWIEFEKKCVAKRVAGLLNNTQVSTRKRSKYYDCLWSLKYLSNFKWPHLRERLEYERAARNKKLKSEIDIVKKKTNSFTSNLDKKRKNKEVVNREYEDMEAIVNPVDTEELVAVKPNRGKFLNSIF